MAEIKLGPVPQIGAPGVQALPARQALSQKSNAAAGTAIVSHDPSPKALDAGAPPIDFERVSTIRKAIESGSYPLVPAKITDAMIAAGFLLRSTAA